MKKEQPKADSKQRRVNFDNERQSTFDKKFEPRKKQHIGAKKRWKTKDVKSSDARDESKYRKSNDSSWYSRNPELLKAAASIPFASIAGSRFPNASVAPGILTIEYQHNYLMGEANNAMKQAFDSMYSYIVHANSRNYTYDSADLAATYLAGADLFSMLATMVRAYGITKFYTEETRYTADALLEAMGFKPQDFRENLGQIWFDINRFIDMSRQVWLPNTMPLLARWIWMNSNVYKDSDGPRAQYYVFTQEKYFRYTPKIGNKVVGSSLIVATYDRNGAQQEFLVGPCKMQYTTEVDYVSPNPVPNHTWREWVQTFESMLKSLIEEEDRGIMYGDILKAYGQEKIFAFPSMPSDYTVVPQYNPEVLTQIENITTVGAYSPVAYVQNQNKLFTPIVRDMKVSLVTTASKANRAYTPQTPVLNFHQAMQPTPEQIMVATRLQAADAYVQTMQSATIAQMLADTAFNYTDVKAYVPLAMGSEFVTEIRVNGLGKTGLLVDKDYTIDLAVFFDWAPFVYNDYRLESQDSGIVGRYSDYRDLTAGWVRPPFLGDLDNYTLINGYELEKLHTVAIYSLLGVPQM